MIIKIIHYKTNSSIFMKRINTNHISTVFFIAKQVFLYCFRIKFCPTSVFTFITRILFISLLFRASIILPSVITLRKITSVLSTLCKNILSPPEHGIKADYHFIGYIFRINSSSLIWIILLRFFYHFFKSIL